MKLKITLAVAGRDCACINISENSDLPAAMNQSSIKVLVVGGSVAQQLEFLIFPAPAAVSVKQMTVAFVVVAFVVVMSALIG
ncbi:hypothetical protein AU254_11910 [Yersinia pestis]|nr:hypothetical protein AU254_11910 [Yersinia pestis]